MKKFLLFCFFIFLAGITFAQDIIVTTDSIRIEAKVLEVSGLEIKYKRMDNLEGPTYIMSTQMINSIIYANGTVYIFHNPSSNNTPLKSLESPSLITRIGEKYTYNGTVMKGDEYANFLMNNCHNAYLLYQSGYTIAYVGGVFLGAAIGAELGTLIGAAIVGGFNSYATTMMYCAGACAIISIPLTVIGYTKMHKSVDLFNTQCASQASRQQSYWSINANPYGIGIAFNF